MNHNTDLQLIKAISRKDKYAELKLIDRYKRDAFFIAQAFYDEHRKSGITLDEYYSVTLSTIVQAAKKYKSKLGKKFIYFYTTMARNMLREYDAENSYLRDAKIFAGTESLDSFRPERHRTNADELGDIDPLIKANVDYGDVMDVFSKIVGKLSRREKKIYTMFLEDYEIKNIADILQIPLSTVYRIIEGISSKIKKEIIK